MWTSLTHSSESPVTPTRSCTRSSVNELSNGTASGCITPQNDSKRYSFCRDDTLTMGGDSPTIPLSQDTINTVTGVAWAWNSPKRATAIAKQNRPKKFLGSNVIVNNSSENSRIQRKKSLTGFYKFQSELKLLQEAKKSSNNSFNVEDKEICIPVPSVPFVSKIPFPSNVSNYNTIQKTNVPHKSWQSDSFNDSDLDRLLLQATQKIDHQFHKRVNTPKHSASEANKENNTEKKKSFVKNHTTDNFDSNYELLNDSEIDAFLIEASQKMETSVGTMKIADETTSASKRINTLTRHKSMPESSSPKLAVCSSKSKKQLNYIPESSASPSNNFKVIDSVTSSNSKVHNVVSVAESHFPTASKQHPMRRCTKEEIEQKRQDALKRLQERRQKQLAKQSNM